MKKQPLTTSMVPMKPVANLNIAPYGGKMFPDTPADLIKALDHLVSDLFYVRERILDAAAADVLDQCLRDMLAGVGITTVSDMTAWPGFTSAEHLEAATASSGYGDMAWIYRVLKNNGARMPR